MAGSSLDMSRNAIGEVFETTLSSTPDEISLLTDLSKCPAGTQWLVIYCSAPLRVGHTKSHSDKTIADTLEADDAHEPVSAGEWFALRFQSHGRLFASSTASARLRIKAMKERP